MVPTVEGEGGMSLNVAVVIVSTVLSLIFALTLDLTLGSIFN